MYQWLCALEQVYADVMSSCKVILSGMKSSFRSMHIWQDYRRYPLLSRALGKLLLQLSALAMAGVSFHAWVEIDDLEWDAFVPAYTISLLGCTVGQCCIGFWSKSLYKTLTQEQEEKSAARYVEDFLFFACSEMQMQIRHLPISNINLYLLPLASILNSMSIHSYSRYSEATAAQDYAFHFGYGLGQQAFLMLAEQVLLLRFKYYDAMFLKNTVRLITLTYLIHNSYGSALLDTKAKRQTSVDVFKPARAVKNLVSEPAIKGYEKSHQALDKLSHAIKS